jgi:hypothetical protein
MHPEKLLGAWSLASSIQSCNDEKTHTYGTPPSGQIQYTADGRMSAFLMDPDWAVTGRNSVEESDRFFAYAGDWQLDGNAVHHTIEFCSAPSKIGNVFTRYIREISDNEIELTTAPETTRSGNVYQTTLVWKRQA